ncbi:unnamed protein product, partial [Meganyctiphanes norvegica]
SDERNMGGKSSKQEENKGTPHPTQPRPDPAPIHNDLNQNGLHEPSVRPRTPFITRVNIALQCPGCRLDFNSTRRQPLVLRCGHNLCEPCVDNNIDRQMRMLCPSCDQAYDCTRRSKPPINFTFLGHLEDVVNTNEIPTTEIHDNGNDWDCHSCTFKNSGMMNICEMCRTQRPTISGPPTSLIPPVEPGTQDDRVTHDASSTTDNSSDDGALTDVNVTNEEHEELTTKEEDSQDEVNCQDSDETDEEPLNERFKKLLMNVAKPDLPHNATETKHLQNSDLHFQVGSVKEGIESDTTENVCFSNINMCPFPEENSNDMYSCDHIENREVKVKIDLTQNNDFSDIEVVPKSEQEYSTFNEFSDDKFKSASHPLSEIQKEDCPICLCSIEGQTLRLESCGHGYCKECLTNMLDHCIRNEIFPLCCEIEECGENIVIKDLTNILESTNSLVHASIDLFVAQNKDLYKYCVTKQKHWQEDLRSEHKEVYNPKVKFSDIDSEKNINNHENVLDNELTVISHKNKVEDDRSINNVKDNDVISSKEEILNCEEVKKVHQTQTSIKNYSLEIKQNNKKKKSRQSKKKLSNVSDVEESAKDLDESKSIERSCKDLQEIPDDEEHQTQTNITNDTLEKNQNNQIKKSRRAKKKLSNVNDAEKTEKDLDASKSLEKPCKGEQEVSSDKELLTQTDIKNDCLKKKNNN